MSPRHPPGSPLQRGLDGARLGLGWMRSIAAACVLLILAGCATPGFFKLSKEKFPKTGPKNPVIRILGMWEPAEGMAYGKSCRGFNAQILFFGQNSDTPAQVDGDVRIYVFDDQGTPEQQAMAFHEFDYPAATWNAFLFNGPLGATYSVFIPYTHPGVHEAKCSLRIRYTPKAGLPAYSDMVNVVLPGTKKVKEDAHPVVTPSGNSAAGTDSPTADLTGRNAPRAQGVSTPLPTFEEIQEQLHAKRPRGVELDKTERRRILQEAKARLETEKGSSKIALAAYEESESRLADDDDRPPKQVHARHLPDDDDEDFFDEKPEVEVVESVMQAEADESR